MARILKPTGDSVFHVWTKSSGQQGSLTLCRESCDKTTDIYLSGLLEFCNRSLIWPESNISLGEITVVTFDNSKTTLVCFRHHYPDADFFQVPINCYTFNEIPGCELYWVSISLQTKIGTNIFHPFRRKTWKMSVSRYHFNEYLAAFVMRYIYKWD